MKMRTLSRLLLVIAFNGMLVAPALAGPKSTYSEPTRTASGPEESDRDEGTKEPNSWILDEGGPNHKPGQGDPIRSSCYDLNSFPGANLRQPIPEAYQTDNLRKDKFFQQIARLPGDKSFIIQDGVPVGIKFTLNGKEFVYRPGEKFAFPVGAGTGEPTVVVLGEVMRGGRMVGGGLQKVRFEQLSPEDRQAAIESQRDLRRLVYGGLGPREIARIFDNNHVAGSGPERGAVRATGAGKKKSAYVPPPEGGLNILNSYKDPVPDALRKGDVYWDGKILMKATEDAKPGAKPAAIAVGYMVAMEDKAQRGTVIFWHGGDMPDENGQPTSKGKDGKNWGLFMVAQGGTSARQMGRYYAFDLSQGKKMSTADGTRLQLWTAMSAKEAFTIDQGKMTSLGNQPMFAFGEPDTFRTSDGRVVQLHRYVGVDGGVYAEKLDSAGRVTLMRERRLASPPAVRSPEADEPTPAPAEDSSERTLASDADSSRSSPASGDRSGTDPRRHARPPAHGRGGSDPGRLGQAREEGRAGSNPAGRAPKSQDDELGGYLKNSIWADHPGVQKEIREQIEDDHKKGTAYYAWAKANPEKAKEWETRPTDGEIPGTVIEFEKQPDGTYKVREWNWMDKLGYRVRKFFGYDSIRNTFS